MSTLVPTRRSLLSRFFDDDAFGLPEGFLEDAGMMPSRLFDRPFLNEMKMPAVNIKDNTDHFAIELAAPGYKKDDLKVTVKDGLLTMPARRSAKARRRRRDTPARSSASPPSDVRSCCPRTPMRTA
ncbi:MAG: Hsp20/alpha crystallin family protein [Flavobacteriales bacterium]|nr:Hsp20/alpha crystallin family protein [Flavobacteriales bacterium]